MSGNAELLKRLDARQEPYYDGKYQDGGWRNDELCQEAAKVIRALEARIKELKDDAKNHGIERSLSE